MSFWCSFGDESASGFDSDLEFISMLQFESKSKSSEKRASSLFIDISTYEAQVKKLRLNAKKFKGTGKRVQLHCKSFMERVRPITRTLKKQVYDAFK